MKGLRGVMGSLLMEWSLFQLSKASEPQLPPGQDDVYNVSNCWSLFSNPPSRQTFWGTQRQWIAGRSEKLWMSQLMNRLYMHAAWQLSGGKVKPCRGSFWCHDLSRCWRGLRAVGSWFGALSSRLFVQLRSPGYLLCCPMEQTGELWVCVQPLPPLLLLFHVGRARGKYQGMLWSWLWASAAFPHSSVWSLSHHSPCASIPKLSCCPTASPVVPDHTRGVPCPVPWPWASSLGSERGQRQDPAWPSSLNCSLMAALNSSYFCYV